MGHRTVVVRWGVCVLLAWAWGVAVGEELVIGQIAPIGVASIPEATELHEGTRACVDQVNRQGGVRGRRLQLFAVNDELQPQRVEEKFREAMSHRPLALLNVMGSGVLGTVLATKALDRNDVVIIGAIPGAEAFRQPGHPRLFHVRSGDGVQLERILVHSRTLGIKHLHVLYQDVGIGASGLAVLQEGARRGSDITVTSTVTTLDPEAVADAVRKSVGSQAQAFVVIGFPHFMADVLKRLREAGAAQAVFGLGYLTPAQAVKVAGVKGARGLGLTQAIPNANGKVLQAQRDFHAAMRQAFPQVTEYSSFHLEGCMAVRVLVEGLKRIDGTPTPAALARALHAMGETDFGGFRVNFGNGQVGSVWSDIGVMSESGRLMF